MEERSKQKNVCLTSVKLERLQAKKTRKMIALDPWTGNWAYFLRVDRVLQRKREEGF